MARTTDPSVPSVQIDGFDQLEPIGRGGFSYVFSARQRDFNRRVAVKVLSFGLVDERERRSFERECRAMGLVSQHPHIVTVFNAAFTTTKQPCIVMELYSGGTMGERQKRDGQLSVAVVLDAGIKIAGALQTAHDRGLLHRDIKPQNLFISEFGEPALGDFGISTLDDERSISGGGGLTVHYAPPEVLEGATASPISDVYSFAATLYTLLEGARPFAPPTGSRQSVGELARRIMLEEPPRARRQDVPRSLAEVLARTMAKDPGARPASAGAFGQELQRIQGELGLPVTSLPLAMPLTPTAPGSPPPPPAPSPTPGAPPWPSAVGSGGASVVPPADQMVAAGRTPVAPVDLPLPDVQIRVVPDAADAPPDDDHGHTITVGRAVTAPDDPTDAEPSGASTKRIVLGTVAAVVCLLLMVGALVLFGGGDGDSRPTTTSGSSGTIPQVVLGPATPVGVFAVRTPDEDVVVSWEQPEDVGAIDRYQVVRQDGGEVVETVDANQLSVTFEDVAPLETACFRVTSIDSSGARSDDSSQACAP